MIALGEQGRNKTSGRGYSSKNYVSAWRCPPCREAHMYTGLSAMTNLFNVAKESHTISTLTVPTDAPATEPSPDEESSGVAVTMAPADHARSDTRPAAATSAPLPDDATAPDADPDTTPDPRIRIYHGRYVDYHDQRRETWDALIGANSRGEAAPVFYRRDGMMVDRPRRRRWLTADPTGVAAPDGELPGGHHLVADVDPGRHGKTGTAAAPARAFHAQHARLPAAGTRRCHQPALFSRRPIGSSRPRWLSRP